MKITRLQQYVLENQFKITFLNNKLDILNYDTILHFDDNKIIIGYELGTIDVYGDGLYISRLLKDEVLIEGIIKRIEFR